MTKPKDSSARTPRSDAPNETTAEPPSLLKIALEWDIVPKGELELDLLRAIALLDVPQQLMLREQLAASGGELRLAGATHDPSTRPNVKDLGNALLSFLGEAPEQSSGYLIEALKAPDDFTLTGHPIPRFPQRMREGKERRPRGKSDKGEVSADGMRWEDLALQLPRLRQDGVSILKLMLREREGMPVVESEVNDVKLAMNGFNLRLRLLQGDPKGRQPAIRTLDYAEDRLIVETIEADVRKLDFAEWPLLDVFEPAAGRGGHLTPEISKKGGKAIRDSRPAGYFKNLPKKKKKRTNGH